MKRAFVRRQQREKLGIAVEVGRDCVPHGYDLALKQRSVYLPRRLLDGSHAGLPLCPLQLLCSAQRDDSRQKHDCDREPEPASLPHGAFPFPCTVSPPPSRTASVNSFARVRKTGANSDNARTRDSQPHGRTPRSRATGARLRRQTFFLVIGCIRCERLLQNANHIQLSDANYDTSGVRGQVIFADHFVRNLLTSRPSRRGD